MAAALIAALVSISLATSAHASTGASARVTVVNAQALSARALADVEHATADAPAGTKVHVVKLTPTIHHGTEVQPSNATKCTGDTCQYLVGKG
ncbi:hypothetical protein [Actinacidiphila acidipaludis]|uniref:hypothetical protein n=1 Tax=Actinacidiphila acidipaludis TaxID=2873382 RepID=UPI00223A9DFA|nr:hypothetical protein [Streptomyces acidipaludis]